jgi:prepilin-type N-terminal cleavage/methylation domain-containing protein
VKKESGFTLIEIIIVIVCIGLLAFISVPRIYDVSTKSKESSEAEMVGSVRTGLQLYYSQQMTATGRGSYPPFLDNAQPGRSGTANPFFTTVLQHSYQGDQWQKEASGRYVGPAGNGFFYNNNDGTFNKAN